jgi:sporulation protein YlmC with PRC-barrel domain
MKNSMSHQIISSSSLEGANVKTTHDESIGEIKDLMIDTSTGEVSYAVLSVSTGFLNLDSKYFAVPLGAFNFDHFNDQYSGRELVLDVSKERLENSPGFDKDNWPTHPDSTFVDSVNTYYGIKDRRSSSMYDESGFGNSDQESRLTDISPDSNRNDSWRDNSLL